MGKPVIGIQVHHSVFLEDALRGAANSRAGLRSAIQRTGDTNLIALAERADEVLRELRAARDKARESLLSLSEHQVIRAREGFDPYPDELAEGFVGRCTCYDQCPIHSRGQSAEDGWICNCGVTCPVHGVPRDGRARRVIRSPGRRTSPRGPS
jgi:hypothetical protein